MSSNLVGAASVKPISLTLVFCSGTSGVIKGSGFVVVSGVLIICSMEVSGGRKIFLFNSGEEEFLLYKI